MDDFILKVRLEALKHTLIQVQNIFDSVRARRKDVLELSQNIETAGQSLNTVMYNLNTLMASAKPAWGTAKVDPSLIHVLDLMQSKGGELSNALKGASASIETIKNRWAPIEKVEELVRESLHVAIENWIEKIDDSLKALKALAEEGISNQPTIEAAWKQYAEIMTEQTRLFSFSDYVEFLGGLALRDAGLDEGICQIADELVQSCSAIGKTNWNALTIPANNEAVTLARSIRMGFPEWTLWAVPLTAHELGHVLITGGRNRLESGDTKTQWERYIFNQVSGRNKKVQRDRQHLLIYLADAFATYAMGPAYACSAILLRFNPLSAYTDGDKYPADAKRAYVILNMLRRMLANDKQDTPPYDKTVDRLEAGWNSALARINSPASLSQAQKDHLESFNSYMLSQLSKGKGLYRGRRLKRTRAALDSLLANQSPSEILKGDEEGRDVLNAAWECRTENKYDLAKLQASAQRLWDLIIEQKSKRALREDKPEPSPFYRVDPPSTTQTEKSWPKQ